MVCLINEQNNFQSTEYDTDFNNKLSMFAFFFSESD